MKPQRSKSALSVLVRCQWLVCALPARAVSRLVLDNEVQVEGNGAGPVLLRDGERRWAGWDLGAMLGVGRTSDAWVLLELGDESGVLPVALRTGPCLRVQDLAADLAVPPVVFRERRSAFTNAFSAKDIDDGARGATGLVGLVIEPSRFWTASELAASRALLASSEARANP